MIVLIDNSINQTQKTYVPYIISYLDHHKISYTIVQGNIQGLQHLKQIAHKVQGIIMSGSPLMLPSNPKPEQYICNVYCLKTLRHIPILGICFGCQLIHTFFGGSLYDLQRVHCRKFFTTADSTATLPWFQHNGQKAQFCCKYLPDTKPIKTLRTHMFVTIPSSDSPLPCVIQHKKRPILGVMFHPEAITETHWVLDYFLDLKKFPSS